MDAYIRFLYYDPKHGFNSQKVYKETKKKYPQVTHAIVNAVIRKQELPTLFAKPKYTYRRHFLVKKPMVQWQIDILFTNLKYEKGKKKMRKQLTLKELAKKLDKLLVAVDVFTKKVYIRRVPTKEPPQITKAFKSMIEEAGSAPKSLYLDKGTEFKAEFQAFCDEQNIKVIRAVKLAPVAERMNRSVKELLQKYKEAYKHNVSDYIQDVADNINSRISRPIKKTPDQATKEYEDNDVPRKDGAEATTVLATPAEAYVGGAPAPSFGAIATKISHRPGLGRLRRCAGARGRAARRRRPRTTGRSRRRRRQAKTAKTLGSLYFQRGSYVQNLDLAI